MGDVFAKNVATSAADAEKIVPRAEFRVFGKDVIELVKKNMWNGKTVLFQARKMPAETYFLSANTDEANVKVRDGLLDIKTKVGETPEGYEILEKYSNGIPYNNQQKPKYLCFDDLGTETSSKYFGNDCNVMAEILLTRYDLFKEKGLITNITTNLTSSEIESQYGNRLRSRMREMFNLFGYEESSEDKRR